MDHTVFKTTRHSQGCRHPNFSSFLAVTCVPAHSRGQRQPYYTLTEPVDKQHADSGAFRAVLGPPALPSLETAGDKDRCLGQPRPGGTRGLWIPGVLVEAVTGREGRAGASWPWASVSGWGHCVSEEPRLLPSEAPGGMAGLKGDRQWAPTEGRAMGATL